MGKYNSHGSRTATDRSTDEWMREEAFQICKMRMDVRKCRWTTVSRLRDEQLVVGFDDSSFSHVVGSFGVSLLKVQYKRLLAIGLSVCELGWQPRRSFSATKTRDILIESLRFLAFRADHVYGK